MTAIAGGDTIKGMAWMLGSALVFSGMHALIRFASEELHPLVIVFYRNLIGVLVLMPLVLRYGTSVFHTSRPGLMVARSGVNLLAMTLYFWALTVAPLAQVTALGFTFPIFLAVLAVLFLGEKVGPRRWIAIILGFVGALIIVRPGFQGLALGDMLTIGSAIMWAVTMMVIKVLSRTESSLTITIYMMLIMTVLSLPPALFFWTWPSLTMLGWLVLLGALGTAGQWMLTESLRLADTSVVTPFDYSRLIWAAGIGYLIFGEVPDWGVWVGGGLIAASATYLAYRERQLSRRVVADAPPAGTEPR